MRIGTTVPHCACLISLRALPPLQAKVSLFANACFSPSADSASAYASLYAILVVVALSPLHPKAVANFWELPDSQDKSSSEEMMLLS